MEPGARRHLLRPGKCSVVGILSKYPDPLSPGTTEGENQVYWRNGSSTVVTLNLTAPGMPQEDTPVSNREFVQRFLLLSLLLKSPGFWLLEGRFLHIVLPSVTRFVFPKLYCAVHPSVSRGTICQVLRVSYTLTAGWGSSALHVESLRLMGICC